MKYQVIVIFILALVSNVLPCYGAAHDVEIDGLYYKLSFDDFTAKVVGRDLHNTNVVIPNEISINGRVFIVNEIGESAFNEKSFSNNTDKYRLKSVKIGDNVKSIYHYAFANCKKLKDVSLNSDVSYVADQILFNSNIDYLEISNHEIGHHYESTIPCYYAKYDGRSLNLVGNIGVCFMDMPLFRIEGLTYYQDKEKGYSRNTTIGTLIISMNGYCDVHTYDNQYAGDAKYENSVVTNGAYGNLSISYLILNADNKKVPAIDAYANNVIALFPDPINIGNYKFNDATYLKAMLYVPDDSYDAYLNHPEWRRFLNIRKFSEIEKSLSPDVKSKLRFTPLSTNSANKKSKYKLRPGYKLRPE